MVAVFDPRQLLSALGALRRWGAGRWVDLRRRRPGSPRAQRPLGLGVHRASGSFNLAAYWLVIPYRTQQRFSFPAAALGVVPLAMLFDPSRRGSGRWGSGLLAVHLAHPASLAGRRLSPKRRCSGIWSRRRFPMPYPGAARNPSDPGWRLSPGSAGPAKSMVSLRQRWPVGIGALGRGRPAGVCGSRRRGWVGRLSREEPGSGLVGGGSGSWRRPLQLGAHTPVGVPVLPTSSIRWLATGSKPWSARKGARIAYAGTKIPYYLLGSQLQSDVRYVPVDAHRGLAACTITTATRRTSRGADHLAEPVPDLGSSPARLRRLARQPARAARSRVPGRHARGQHRGRGRKRRRCRALPDRARLGRCPPRLVQTGLWPGRPRIRTSGSTRSVPPALKKI